MTRKARLVPGPGTMVAPVSVAVAGFQLGNCAGSPLASMKPTCQETGTSMPPTRPTSVTVLPGSSRSATTAVPPAGSPPAFV